MNNLKFRVWDKTNKEMLNIDVLNLFLEEVVVLEDDGSAFSMKFKDVEFMQSTGLFDKDGKEIFEGDILTDEGSFENDCWDYATIEFDETDYTYYLHWKNEEVYENITECKKYVVAGNIFENKDLLEE
ncbi:YopX family protein [uncultured Sneathia sp.]|uniref:YopX family protein n=1 Tax=uncultured Sneathia sp. TaxID=278067 RepID=UPI00259A4835|nr:YopX family protein [uncultured Sneathia sp.]